MPTEETGRLANRVAVESSTICATDAQAGYFAAKATGEDEVSPAPFSDDWRFLSVPSLTSGMPTLESDKLATGDERIPKLWGDVEKDRLMASCDPVLTAKDICLPFDVAAVPGDVCESPTKFSAETFRDEIYVDTSVSLPAASDDISSSYSDISFLHTVGACEPSLQLRVGETVVLPAVEEITISPLIASSSMFLAAVEVCQSSDQPLYVSDCEPVYAHPDVICMEAAFDSERPIVLEREQTYGGDPDQQRVPFGPQFPSQSSVEEIRQPDGTVVRRRVIRTRVRRVATRRVRRRQPDGRVVEYTETVELPEEEGGGNDGGQLSELVGAASDAGAAGQVLGVHTDTEPPGEPQVDTDVEVVRETLPDGRVLERRIVRTRKRRTIVKRVVVRPDRS